LSTPFPAPSSTSSRSNKHDLNSQDTELSKTIQQKKTVNLWKHVEKTEGICTFNEAVRDILYLREFHKQMDKTVLKAYGWEDDVPGQMKLF
jgi:hypothetical protein